MRGFVAREVKPFAVRPERLEALDRSLPLDLLDKASQLGLRTLACRGGAGRRRRRSLTPASWPSSWRGASPTSPPCWRRPRGSPSLLFDHAMTAEQRERFLPAFLGDDQYHLAVAEDEPGDRPAARRQLSSTGGGRAGAPDRRPRASRANGSSTGSRTASPTRLRAARRGRRIDRRRRRHHPVARECARRPPVRAHGDAERWSMACAARSTFGLPRAGAESAGRSLRRRTRTAAARRSPRRSISVSAGRPTRRHSAMRSSACRAVAASSSIRRSAASSPRSRSAWKSPAPRSGDRRGLDHPEAQADRSVADLPLATIAQGVFVGRRSMAPSRMRPNASAQWA